MIETEADTRANRIAPVLREAGWVVGFGLQDWYRLIYCFSYEVRGKIYV